MIAFDFAVDADGTIAFQAEKLKFYGGMEEAVADDLWFLSKFRPFVFGLQPIFVVGLIARDTQIGILRLAVLPRNILITQLTRNFLHNCCSTSLSSRYLD